MNQTAHPELINYLGFTGEEEDIEMEDESTGQNIYEDHLTYSEMVLGIKEGRFF